MLEEQVRLRTQKIILSPIGSLDETLAQEYAKGEVAALQLTLSMPEALVETLSEEIKQENEELKNASE